MKEELCGCCEGLEKLTPMVIANRPGLNALAYRVGTHATFLETMKARLTDHFLEVPTNEVDEDGRPKTVRLRPLSGLTTRAGNDPSIALLDAWATMADALTFYQERIANEGYLRTATERRSILELARLVGYRLRPGVAASVYLAFTLEKGYKGEIPAGTRAQSLPKPGELPQSFETVEPLLTRTEWNELKPRATRPQKISADTRTLYLQGAATNLTPNAPILIDFGTSQEPYRVETVEPDAAADRTKVTLRSWQPKVQAAAMTTASLAAMSMPANLHATALRAFATSLSKVGELSPTDLEQLVQQLAAALLTTFAALAEMPPSSTRDEAIEETVAALEAVKAAVEQIKAGVNKNSMLAKYLDMIIAWIDQALAILKTGMVPTPEGPQVTSLVNIVDDLLKPLPAAAIPPRSSLYLPRALKVSFAKKSDLGPRLLTHLQPALQPLLYAAWRNAAVTGPSPAKVYALRTTASLFGHNAPKRFDPETGETSEWPVIEDISIINDGTKRIKHEEPSVVYLDASYDRILPDSWVVVETSDTTLTDQDALIARARNPNAAISRGEYGITGKTTRIELANPADSSQSINWITADLDTVVPSPDNDFEAIRRTAVYVQSEMLDLAEEPLDTIEKPEPVEDDHIELDDLYEGLESGRWLIVSGERTDIPGVTDVTDRELVMLASVKQGFDATLPGDKTHSTLILANSLAYTYKRDTVTIYGNVVKATHGETRQEVLGSGDGSKALQRFALKQSPLTYLAARTPAGAESTLQVRVNEVLWHEADNLFALEPNDRGYITRTDNDDKTTLTFGDGQHGARLPTGVENVKAVYRSGIGKPGNVAAEQISLLATRPLGVKGVINPLRASGGTDRESRDQARRNAPLAVMALDRLVSVQDYADFARTYAGIGKASAVRLTDGRRQVVHVTIAGADDIPIDETSDLYQNLCQALHQFGDPYQPIQVDVRELMLLVISTRVRLLPDYQWEPVEPQVRAALLEAFSFDHRELGQDVLLSEAISVTQGVPGVAYVDVDILDSVHQDITPEQLEKLTDPDNPDRLRLKKRIEVDLARIDEKQTYYTVQPGDNLTRIAERYGATVEVLVRLNKDKISDPNLIYTGDTLLIRRERVIKSAQLAYLSPDVTDTLILTELTS